MIKDTTPASASSYYTLPGFSAYAFCWRCSGVPMAEAFLIHDTLPTGVVLMPEGAWPSTHGEAENIIDDSTRHKVPTELV